VFADHPVYDMLDTVREAPLGQAIRFITCNRLLRHPEERLDFELPQQYASLLGIGEKANQEYWKARPSAYQGTSSDHDDTPSVNEASHSHDLNLEALQSIRTMSTIRSARYTNEQMRREQMLEIARTTSIAIQPQKTEDGVILVDWYTTDDPANPQNWSSKKKRLVIFILCCYTWTVYLAGPVYVASEFSGILEDYHIGPVAASLGLSLYVLAYGIGDLLFSPLTEIPIVGRNSVYYLTFVAFWALSFGPPLVRGFGGFLALRFWLGFFGSPALANGGATVGDMYSLIYIPYGLCWWVLSAWCGPAFGPIIGGFAAMAKGWRWPMWEIVWLASPLLILMACIPETSAANILLRRARRLRKVTGDSRLQSQSEIDQRNLSAKHILFSALVRPMEIMLKDPSIFFVNLYTGYFYAVFYTFFEVFPLVFPPFYGFDLGQTGLAFIACLIGVLIALAAYFVYLFFYMVPDNLKNGFREQEHRLVPAIVGSILLPIGLFLFAWTADPHIHWTVPLIGVAIFTFGHFWTMQSLFIYIPFSYPQFAASLFAGNSLWRSGAAGGAIVFARPLFINLGVHRGVTLLAGLSAVGIFGTTALYVFGKRLRARSKFATS
jgi:DHA1 family multidrug resistance protein-like MFS transporter